MYSGNFKAFQKLGKRSRNKLYVNIMYAPEECKDFYKCNEVGFFFFISTLINWTQRKQLQHKR